MGVSAVTPRPGAWLGIVIEDDTDEYKWAWASTDSGSDVHTMPMNMQKYGRHEPGLGPQLRDVQ
eukprot:14043630-Heterocapsa_arctica.AAC.1